MRVTCKKPAAPSMDHPQVTCIVELRMTEAELRAFQTRFTYGPPEDAPYGDAIVECIEEHLRTKYKCSRMTEGH